MNLIFSRGSIDGICATALYLKHKYNKKELYHVTFCEYFELDRIDSFLYRLLKEYIDAKGKGFKRSSLIFISLDTNYIYKKLDELSEIFNIIIYTTKRTKLVENKDVSVFVDTNSTACNIIYNQLLSKNKDLNKFDEYLVIIANLSNKTYNFSDYPQLLINQVVNFARSLTLNPYDNNFRKNILNRFLSEQYIFEIDIIRERSIKVEVISKIMVNNAYLHKVSFLNESKIVVYEYFESDTITFENKDYRIMGHFSYLSTQLAIINKKICCILVHKDIEDIKKDSCYIVMRKHNNVRRNLLNIANSLQKYFINELDINKELITYNGNPFAVSINIKVDIDPGDLTKFILSFV